MLWPSPLGEQMGRVPPADGQNFLGDPKCLPRRPIDQHDPAIEIRRASGNLQFVAIGDRAPRGFE